MFGAYHGLTSYRVNNPRTWYNWLTRNSSGSATAAGEHTKVALKDTQTLDLVKRPFDASNTVDVQTSTSGDKAFKIAEDSDPSVPITMSLNHTLQLNSDPGWGKEPIVCVIEASTQASTMFDETWAVEFDLTKFLINAGLVFAQRRSQTGYSRIVVTAFAGLLQSFSKQMLVSVSWSLKHQTVPTDQYDQISFGLNITTFGFRDFVSVSWAPDVDRSYLSRPSSPRSESSPFTSLGSDDFRDRLKPP